MRPPATRLILRTDEDRKAFSELEAGFRLEIKPQGHLQDFLFLQLVLAAWNMRRCDDRHAELSLLESPEGMDPLDDPKAAARIRLIESFYKRNERTFNRAWKQIKELQTEQVFRQEQLSEEENTNPTLSILLPSAQVRQQYYADDMKRNAQEMQELRLNYDPKYAIPRLQRERDRQAALTAATVSGVPKAA